jgi:lipoic acid synthetase
MPNKPGQLGTGKKRHYADKLFHIPIKAIPSDKSSLLKNLSG